MNEFGIEWVKGGRYAGVTATSASALKNKLFSLMKKHPDRVKLIRENLDGSVFFHIPISYVKIQPQRELTDEQREAASSRMQQMWKNKKNKEDEINE